MSSVEQTATSPRMTLPPLPTVPSYADMRTCSYKESAAAENPSLHVCALGRQACMLGYRTLYLNMNSFVEKVALSKLDGSYLRMITNLEKYDLLIWDGFGAPMDDKTRLAMLQILRKRYERKSVIIASQLPIAKWYDYIGDPTLADAIMDRLVANASKIELKGNSMRQKLKK